MAAKYDVIVVGGGLFGCALALQSALRADCILLVEKEKDLVKRASHAHQARIHQGSQYPRSLLTGLRSRVNFQRFLTGFEDCIERQFDMCYAIAATSWNVGAAPFRAFFERIRDSLPRMSPPDCTRYSLPGPYSSETRYPNPGRCS